MQWFIAVEGYGQICMGSTLSNLTGVAEDRPNHYSHPCRAGAGYFRAEKAGEWPAVLMCFVPASFELLGVLLLAPKLRGLTVLEAAILGAVLAAVSPAAGNGHTAVKLTLQEMEAAAGAEGWVEHFCDISGR